MSNREKQEEHLREYNQNKQSVICSGGKRKKEREESGPLAQQKKIANEYQKKMREKHSG